MFCAQHNPADDDPGRRLEGRPACVRCHSDQRLVVGDGPVVCWPCALAWGSFAALVAGGPTAIEPVMVGTCRTGHRQPRPGCAWCLARLGDQSASGLPGLNGQRGPAA